MSYLGQQQNYPVVYGDVAQDPFTGQYIHPATGEPLTPEEVQAEKQLEAQSDAAATQKPLNPWIIVGLVLLFFLGKR